MKSQGNGHWRWRVGVATLVMAGAITMNWIQSFDTLQKAEFSIGTLQVRIETFRGHIYVFCWNATENRLRPFWVSTKLSKRKSVSSILANLQGQLAEARMLAGGWQIPYWSIALPPTLLSMWLLLSGRHRRRVPGSESS